MSAQSEAPNMCLADADARKILANSVAGITDACATEVTQLLETIEEP